MKFTMLPLEFLYWKGPLHYMDIETNEDATELKRIFYADYPEVEMIFICNGARVMELRKRDENLSLNALTSIRGGRKIIHSIVRGVSEDGTIHSPSIGCIIQELKTKKISKKEAKKIATEWFPLNPHVKDKLISYGLLAKE